MSSEAVRKQIQELEALKKQTGLWKLGGTLAILFIAIFCVYSMYAAGRDLIQPGPPREVFMGELKSGITNQIVPDIKLAATNAFKAVKAEIDTEIKNFSENILPALTDQAQEEAMILGNNLQDQGETLLNDTFGKMLRDREATIRKMYPGITQEKLESITEQLLVAVEAQLNTLIEDTFIQQMVVLENIVFNISHIRDSNELDLLEKDAPWEMAILIFEIVEHEFHDTAPDEAIIKQIEDELTRQRK